jgi:Zn-dependent peptidase ImmA (M78 family)
MHSSIDIIVEDIRQALQVGLYPERGNSDAYYRDLIVRIELLGILVMRQANLGHFTRLLQVEEFRGFAITDEYAPVIFVNHADAPGARLFTLIHELCHIWIGHSGISDGDARTTRQEEMLCNAVAAEFLVPKEEFIQLWQPTPEHWQDNLAPLERHFRVSRWVLARRALTLQFIGYDDYARYIAGLKAEWQKREKSDGGPNYYRTKKAQISLPFSRAVVGQAMSGQILLREASSLLDGIKPANIPVFAKELGL